MGITIEHSKNKVITPSGMSENEIRPGVLMTSVQQACLLQHATVSQGTSLRELFKFQLCRYCLELLQSNACWKLNYSTPGPTSFSKLVIILFSECSIVKSIYTNLYCVMNWKIMRITTGFASFKVGDKSLT